MSERLSLRRWLRMRLSFAILWIADRLDIGLVLIMIDYNVGATGIACNYKNRFPQCDERQLLLDTLRTAVTLVKFDVEDSHE